MTVLSIDIETYSDVNLKDCGVYKYVDSEQFKILLFAYAFDDEKVEVIDLDNGERPPKRVASALLDKNTIKTAFNAQFERLCINKHFGMQTENWDCSMVKALTLGFPGNLASVGQVIGIEPDKQKLMTGKNLIRLFSIPRKPSKANGYKTVFTKTDKPEEWEQFKDYCIRDVEAEREIRIKLDRFETLKQEQDLYKLDQKINDAGVLIDLDMVQKAISIDTEQVEQLTENYRKSTGLENPNSVAEIKKFIKEKTGKKITSITKDTLPELIKDFKDFPEIITALEIRQLLSKTSISKYKKMLEVACRDRRARGLVQFYGASRTGRWAGRLVQVQNLPRNNIKDLETARNIIKDGSLELLEMMYESPADILSQCIRTAIIPAKGKRFIVSDFSAIEARVIAWLAGEHWRIDVFNSHGKIYEASASQMFDVPVESIDKGSPLRDKGKIAELALGYQGSIGALKQMGALSMGLEEGELQGLVNQWRGTNSKIVRFWYETEAKVMEAIENRTTVKINDYVTAIYLSGILFIELPSGRRLAYVKPKIVDHDKFPGKKKIIFQDMNPTTYQWRDVDTYGGKLAENIVQATARDCLAHSMLELDKLGYKLVMHVHDEVVIEIDEDKDDLEKITDLMGRDIPWAPGLPLNADGFYCSAYRKD